MEYKNFIFIIRDVWNEEVLGIFMFVLWKKFWVCNKFLKDFFYKDFGYVDKYICEVCLVLE